MFRDDEGYDVAKVYAKNLRDLGLVDAEHGTRVGKTFNEVLEQQETANEFDDDGDADERDDGDADEGDDTDKTTAPDDLVSRVIEMHDGQLSRAEALEWLLAHPIGREVHRSYITNKGTNDMNTSTTEVVAKFKREHIAKLEAMGPVAVAKIAITAPDALQIDESEFVGLITRAAQKAHPNLRPDAAFAKMFSASTSDGTLLRKAHAVIKATPFYAAPQVVGGEDARSPNDPSAAMAAYNKLLGLAAEYRKANPALSVSQAFSAVFQSRENAELAAKAHQRPTPPANGAYEYPR
jgi:hypothetical protein